MMIVRFKLYFCALDYKILKLTYFLYRNDQIAQFHIVQIKIHMLLY